MHRHSSSIAKLICIAAVATALVASHGFAQGKGSKDNARPDPDAGTRLRIEVTGGDASVPIDSASVYVRYVVKHLIGKDENVEMDVKTNSDGIASCPPVPRGKVIVQVVAEGWKPYGETLDATEDRQTVKVHLVRPPKWY